VPKLTDQGVYIASESSFYRILREADEQHHRGRSRKPRASTPPKGYCATGPNQVWSWDITYLPTLVRGIFFYLYMIMDVFSRKIVGWEVHAEESGFNAGIWSIKRFCLKAAPRRRRYFTKTKVCHRKASPCGRNWKHWGDHLLQPPHVSDDNPYSEALFRTVKYRPDYPYRGFESLEEARRWVLEFLRSYNHDHQHSAIRFVTPCRRHDGEDHDILAARRRVYEEAKARHPERWNGNIRNWEPVAEVWLNPPADADRQPTSAGAA